MVALSSSGFLKEKKPTSSHASLVIVTSHENVHAIGLLPRERSRTRSNCDFAISVEHSEAGYSARR
jgi:hypothetical protein